MTVSVGANCPRGHLIVDAQVMKHGAIAARCLHCKHQKRSTYLLRTPNGTTPSQP